MAVLINQDGLTGYKNCPAPAKLNLFLHVVGRRPDGYHLLESAFQLIDLCDRLHFINRSDGVIHRLSEMEGVPEETDLTVRAATRLKKEALAKKGQRVPGVDISIEKSIPAGGGLGGGSSDAATTLMVLNKLWNCGFTLQDLARIGVSLGADVPFFLFRQNAFVQGIGEIMTPIETPSGWFVVIKPPIFVPTKLIFQSPELTRSTERIKMKSYPYFCDSYIKEGKNDLQPVAVSIFPEIQEALDDLGQYGNARMTGSGACVFAYFESEDVAREAEEGLSSKWEVMVIRSLKHHPLDLMGKSTGQ